MNYIDYLNFVFVLLFLWSAVQSVRCARMDTLAATALHEID